MEDIGQANSSYENIKIDADGLADLPVADEQADETKGGTGAGSRDSHWRESTFGNELMTP